MTQTEPPAFNPITSAWNTVASFTSYEEAQAAVDKLSDLQFPVENLDIIGSDLRTVEHITGRLTSGRATTAGAASGAWFGLFFGLLVGLFSTGPTWVGLILGGVFIGALWGAIFGYIGHSAMGGRRDFSSQRSLLATRYDVVARGGFADDARRLLGTSAVAAAPPTTPPAS
jgi:hypothetical protein